MFGVKGFYYFLQSATPEPPRDFASTADVWVFQAVYVAVSLVGIALAYLLYGRASEWTRAVLSVFAESPVHKWWFANWGFDWLYQKLLVAPYVALARLNRDDFVDTFYVGLALASRETHRLMSLTVNGNVRWYVAGVAGGAVLVIGLVVIL
jgi:NADH-quinone oxidoreductase subunit L